MASVKLPTHPSAEISFAAGIRPKLVNIDFDLAWTFYSYPDERWWLLGPDRRHRLLGGKCSRRNADHGCGADRRGLRLVAQCVKYRRTGQYYAAGFSYDLPRYSRCQTGSACRCPRVSAIRASVGWTRCSAGFRCRPMTTGTRGDVQRTSPDPRSALLRHQSLGRRIATSSPVRPMRWRAAPSIRCAIRRA